jgi:hypothetical protein
MLTRLLPCAALAFLLPYGPKPAEPGWTTVLFFVTSDCPISNSYAPEIQRICGEYGRKGVACSLVYEDVSLDAEGVRKHLDDYLFRGIHTVIDRDRSVAARSGATVTPQAVLMDANGDIRYRGRIDNRYEELGRPRRVVTVRDLRDALDAVLDGKPVPRPETPALGCYIVSPDLHRKSP